VHRCWIVRASTGLRDERIRNTGEDRIKTKTKKTIEPSDVSSMVASEEALAAAAFVDGGDDGDGDR